MYYDNLKRGGRLLQSGGGGSRRSFGSNLGMNFIFKLKPKIDLKTFQMNATNCFLTNFIVYMLKNVVSD